MTKDRIEICSHYICKDICELGREANHNRYCQKCNKYNPRTKKKHINRKKQKLNNIKKKEIDL